MDWCSIKYRDNFTFFFLLQSSGILIYVLKKYFIVTRKRILQGTIMYEVLIFKWLFCSIVVYFARMGVRVFCVKEFSWFISLINQFVSVSFQVSSSTWQRPLMPSAGPSKNYILFTTLYEALIKELLYSRMFHSSIK